MAGKKVIAPTKQNVKEIADKIRKPDKIDKLSISFSNFKLQPINLRGKFNNHFKDMNHYNNIVTNLLMTILPKITSHTYTEVCESSNEGRQLHFHNIDEKHRIIVRQILKEYNYSDLTIDQMFEGNNIYEFSASLGHVNAARIVCHKVGDVLDFLFIDTNHHIYIDEKYTKNSMFYDDCPLYLENRCDYMPGDCFAVSYLDEKKIAESYCYSLKPGK